MQLSGAREDGAKVHDRATADAAHPLGNLCARVELLVDTFVAGFFLEGYHRRSQSCALAPQKAAF